MALVGYSDSESSGEEQKPAPKVISKPTTSDKPAFQKVIDRSNPHKIKVTLPETSKASPIGDEAEDGPPAKRAKIGGGTFGGFNALLPAPKRTTGTPRGAEVGIRRGGLGSGVSLKTGAAPGFSREPMPTPKAADEDENNELGDDGEATAVEKFEQPSAATLSTNMNGAEKPKDEPKKQGNPMMFKPLSVARKPQKKKANTATTQTVVKPASEQEPIARPNAPPKVSLFSMGEPEREAAPSIEGTGGYQPLVYQVPSTTGTGEDPSEDTPNGVSYTDPENPSAHRSLSTNTPLAPQSLDAIASDLNLSASAKRQLLGRKGSSAPINIVSFNTDREYAANELLRQAGEQAVHNPVRALAAGKHSLKQLVNAVSTQKDALEEHFASGRRNKREAGSKYGW